jgi:hypothetical protein
MCNGDLHCDLWCPVQGADPDSDPDLHGSAFIRVVGSGSGSRRQK